MLVCELCAFYVYIRYLRVIHLFFTFQNLNCKNYLFSYSILNHSNSSIFELSDVIVDVSTIINGLIFA